MTDPATPRPDGGDGLADVDGSRPERAGNRERRTADGSRPNERDDPTDEDASRPGGDDGPVDVDRSRPDKSDGSAGGDGSRPSEEDGLVGEVGSRPPRAEHSERRTAGGSSGAARIAAAALVASAVAYSSWMLAGWLNPPLNSLGAYASELAATDQPWSAFFRSADLAAGLAAVVAGVLAARRRPWLGWACVTAFGVLTIVDAGLFPMACAPSLDAACSAAEAAGTTPLRHQIHTVSSSLAATAPLLGLIVIAWTLRTITAWVLCGLMLAATAATTLAVATERLVGLGQRFQLLVVTAWLLWLAIRLRRDTVTLAAEDRSSRE